MLFQLPSFIIFFIVVLIIIRFSSARWTKLILLSASIFFYASWNINYTYILLFYITLGIVACRTLIRFPKSLSLWIIICLLPLLFYKYTNFLLHTIGVYPLLQIGLPLGVSFITFTLISMIVDFSRSSKKPFSAIDTSLYISIFPHLIAGPILRSKELIPQLSSIKITWSNIKYNLPLFAIGMIKKVLVADQLGSYIDPIFSSPIHYGLYDLITAAVGFSIQIYCDFSAYSDMAIATAGMLGICFPENFRSPYLAYSLTETWRKWHMTLSFWLRDYVFMSLFRHFRNSLPLLPIFLTMVVSGLWHGANWTFVIWGGLQGIIMMIESYTGYNRLVANKWLYKKLAIFINFVIWTLLLILFRSPSIDSSLVYYIALFKPNLMEVSQYNFEAIGLIIATLVFHKYDNINDIRNTINRIPSMISMPVIAAIIIGSTIVAAQSPANFYYFDF